MRVILCLALLALLAFPLNHPCNAAPYTAVEITDGGRFMVPTDINNCSQVLLGTVVWRNRSLARIEAPADALDCWGQCYVQSYAINDRGQVVGRYGDYPDRNGENFVWDAEAGFRLVTNPDASSYVLRSVSNDGSMVFLYTLFRPPVLVNLGATRIIAVSPNGNAVGYTDGSPSTQHVVLNDGANTFLTLGAAAGYPYAVNDNGDIVGVACDGTAMAPGCQRWGFVARRPRPGVVNNGIEHAVTDLPEGEYSRIRDINSGGLMVGVHYVPDGEVTAMLVFNGQHVDLSNLIPADYGAILADAVGINDRGEIAVRGRYPNDPPLVSANFVARPFLLSPTNELRDVIGEEAFAAILEGRRNSEAVCSGYQPRAGLSGNRGPSLEVRRAPNDYTGDQVTDLVVWRPQNGMWYIKSVATGEMSAVQWGLPGDQPLFNFDLEGDGKADPLVVRPIGGSLFWFIRGEGTALVFPWGYPGDTVLTANTDGIGGDELIVYRDGLWFIFNPITGEATVRSWGMPGDEPLTYDYNNDGRADLAVVRRENDGRASWFIIDSTADVTCVNCGVSVADWGFSTDLFLAGYFTQLTDSGANLIAYRPSEGHWYLRSRARADSFSDIAVINWGLPGSDDVPLVFQQSSGVSPMILRRPAYLWFLPEYPFGIQWGLPGDAAPRR